MRKFWKIVRWPLGLVAGALLTAAVVLAITGVPNVGNVVARNVPRVGWSNLPAVLGATRPPDMLFMFGFDENHDLEFDRGDGRVLTVDDATVEIVQTA